MKETDDILDVRISIRGAQTTADIQIKIDLDMLHCLYPSNEEWAQIAADETIPHMRRAFVVWFEKAGRGEA